MNSDYLKKPVISKKIEYKKLDTFSYVSCEMQGWRRSMQDAILYEQIQEGIHLFGVFDGHGGAEVSNYVANMLPKEIINEPYFKLKNYPRALINVFKRIDQLVISSKGEEELLVLNKRLGGMPAKNGQKISHRAGTTAIVMIITKDKYYVANIGDCRAVLSRQDSPIPLSSDHKPQVPSEKNRIQKAGGFVQNGRVNGTLSLSRCFGDYEYKFYTKRPYSEQILISLPEIVEIQRQQTDDFIIIGCDGVWQKYVTSNQKMISHIKQLRHKNKDKKLVIQKLFNDMIAKDLKELCGCDNMSGILIEFN